MKHNILAFTKLPTEYPWKMALQFYLEQFYLLLICLLSGLFIWVSMLSWQRHNSLFGTFNASIALITLLVLICVSIYIFLFLRRLNSFNENSSVVQEIMQRIRRFMKAVDSLAALSNQYERELDEDLQKWTRFIEINEGLNQSEMLPDEIEEIKFIISRLERKPKSLEQIRSIFERIKSSVDDLHNLAESVISKSQHENVIIRQELDILKSHFSVLENNNLSTNENYLKLRQLMQQEVSLLSRSSYSK
jgi:hypothetical protein